MENLVNYIAENRTTIEVCLTSNLQTSPGLVDVRDHSLQKMLDHRLSLTFCTDNRLVSHTTVTRELTLALDNFSIPGPAQGHHRVRLQALVLLPPLLGEEEVGAQHHRLLRDPGEAFQDRLAG